MKRTHEWEIATHLELQSAIERRLADKEAELVAALERLDSGLREGVRGGAATGARPGIGESVGRVSGSVHGGDSGSRSVHGRDSVVVVCMGVGQAAGMARTLV